MLARVPVDKAILEAEPSLAGKLQLSKELRSFAVKELGLPNNKSYSSFVALKREYPVWVVIAAPQFSLNAKQWCYLVVGCASYRGYFSKNAALNYAQQLKQRGFETHVGGAAAYSTLGWFADPLLPSMMLGSDAGFAETLFHELAHQKLYIKGDSELNEAFATFVGQHGAKQWLRDSGSERLANYEAALAAQRDFANLINSLKSDLREVYDSPLDVIEKSNRKASLFNEFGQRYQTLKEQRWQNRGYFDNWLLTPINNARVAAFSTYHDLVPELELFFKRCDGDLERFYTALSSKRDISENNEC